MKIIDWIRSKFAPGQRQEISTRDIPDDIWNLYEEFRIREFAFFTCVNMIANALGRCEFRTYENRKEEKKAEYYMWNVDPSRNENSTMFLHHLIANLYRDNEVLLIVTKNRDRRDGIVVADAWTAGPLYASVQREYSGIRVGDTVYNKKFLEEDVIHIRLNNQNMRVVVDGLNYCFEKLLNAVANSETWKNGQHWKVHIDNVEGGDGEKEKKFRELINDQFKPFLKTSGAVLPEFNGYKYENVTGSAGSSGTRDVRSMIDDIFDMTFLAFGIPIVLIGGKVESTKDANMRFLTTMDAVADQISEEINRKRYSYNDWRAGTYLRIDTSSIMHYDIFENAAAIEKIVGSAAYCINDIRRATGDEPIPEPWADKHYLTKNIGTMENSSRALEDEKGEKPDGKENVGSEAESR